MKTLVFVGPPGSGKTTTASHTFRSGMLLGKKIYIINDEGDGTEATVDAGILKGIEGLDLAALTQGCIGCRDEKEFREAIEKIQKDGTIDWLVIEPVGYAAGHEVPNILHSLDIHPTVVCLLDVENFQENLVDGFMPTQIRAAQVIVLTKYGSAVSTQDLLLEPVIQFIGEHNSKAPVILLEQGAQLPEWIFSSSHACCHPGHHHHDHDHDHHHDHDSGNSDHGTFSITFRLRLEASYGNIRQIVATVSDIFRGKGVVRGKQWHLVQKTWEPEEAQLSDDRPPFATFYSREPISMDDFVSIAIPTEDTYAGKDTKQILRSRTVSQTDLERAIRKRLTIFPKEAFTNRFGDLVTHPEILSVINQLVKRPGVPPSLLAETTRASIQYWLSAMEMLKAQAWEAHRPVGEWEQAVSIALAWYGWNQSAEIGEELLGKVVQIRPAHIMCHGLAKHRRLHSNFEKAKIQVWEICDAVRFGIKWEGMTQDQAIAMMSGCLSVIEQADRNDLAIEWRNAMGFIQALRL